MSAHLVLFIAIVRLLSPPRLLKYSHVHYAYFPLIKESFTGHYNVMYMCNNIIIMYIVVASQVRGLAVSTVGLVQL